MMDYALAEKQYNISDEIDMLVTKYNLIKRQQLKTDNTTESKEKQESILAKITKIEKNKIELKVFQLAQQETEYAPSDRITTRTFTGLQIEVNDYHKACDNSTIVSASEKVTGKINTDTDTISWDWGIPDAKSTGWFWPNCENVYFKEIDLVRNNSKGLSCTMKTDNQQSGNIIQTCNCGIDSGNLLSWSVQTTYEPLMGSDNSGNEDWRGLYRV